MRKVVDTNLLQNDELRVYLAVSRYNYAVLTDYAAMEAYKGDTLKSIFPSMEILAGYPRQVIVLKATRIACGLAGRAARFPKALIDKPQTREFQEFCLLLRAAKGGDPDLRKQLLEHGRAATAHIERLLADMSNVSSGIAQMKDFVENTHSSAELKILRRSKLVAEEIGAFTPEMSEKMIQIVFMLTKEMYGQHPDAVKPPDTLDIHNSFIFRYALCTYLLILKAVRTGGVKTNPRELRNDVIDMNFATFATYFDDLMTKDELPSQIYADAKFLLREIFGRPPAWLRWILRRKWYPLERRVLS